jgi:hypothetical protein
MIAARRAAGLPPPPPGRRGKSKWSEDEVIAQIKDRRLRGRSLASSKVPRKLHDAANYYLGGWREAVEAAGIDYDEVRLTRAAYSRHEIITTLRALAKSHPDMTKTELRRHRVKNGVETSFASLDDALRAAGLHRWPRRDRRQPMPTASETLTLIRARDSRGLPMLRTAVLRDDPRLERAATRNFGGWLPALRTAGLDAVSAPRGRYADRESRGLREPKRAASGASPGLQRRRP